MGSQTVPVHFTLCVFESQIQRLIFLKLVYRKKHLSQILPIKYS